MAVKKHGGYRLTALLLGCSIVTIHYWISGKRRPSADNLKLLKEKLGISIEAWFQPARVARPVAAVEAA